jgi:hypothetical protein
MGCGDFREARGRLIMPLFLYLGVLGFVLALFVIAVATTKIRRFGIVRIGVGTVVVVASMWTVAATRDAVAKRESAFERQDAASATVIESHDGVHSRFVVVFRVESADCEFEDREQVSRAFAERIGCVPAVGCPSGVQIPVVLGEERCSEAYADPEDGPGTFATNFILWMAAVAALAGLVFIIAGARQAAANRS